jgi:glutamate-1-semialdehyde 2,1-aminomutase/spore coat polysaccharide biosynthesis protein SpsF
MKTVAIIQARMGSNRLPGKVLADLGGQPVLAWVVRAARAIPGADEVWVATSTHAADDEVAAWCAANAVRVYRGSEHDVLERFARTAEAAGADVLVRITADCPLFDPAVAGLVLRLRAISGADYASNVDPRTWPDGLDCEVVTAAALRTAAAEATEPSDREHVTPYVRNNRARFTWETLISPLAGLPGERWTLDTADDLRFLQEIARRLKPGQIPSYLDVLTILDREPQLRAANLAAADLAGLMPSGAPQPAGRPRTFRRSQELIGRAEQVIPLGSQTFSKSRLQYPPGAAPLFATHGDGGRIFDVDGNQYVDLVSALLPIVLGYRDRDVDSAIRRQLTRGISLSLPSELETELAERLRKHIPCAEMARFGKNGTDATSAAIRLARAATRRDRVMALGYHGWQDWYIGATTRNLGVPAAVTALTHLAPYGDLAAADKLLKAHPGEFAAVILEPAGATEPPPGYLQGLLELTHQHGALLVFDEIITGFRWALGGAQARYGVTPDLACFGKAMGNGMPISAVVGRASVMRLMEQIFYSGTFGGEALSLAAAIATIDKIERRDVIGQLWRTGGELMAGARQRIAAAGLEGVIGLVGVAPWAILSFKDHAAASRDAIKTLFLTEMIQAGVLINASHNVCFAHTPQDVAQVLAAYDRALPAVREALAKGDLERRLQDRIIRPVFAVRAAS